MNIYINTESMKNREKAEELNRKADEMLAQGIGQADQIYEMVRKGLRG